MKKLLLVILIAITTNSCENSNSNLSESCTYNGHALHVGEKGGCYYLSSGGNKEYIDKSYCSGCY